MFRSRLKCTLHSKDQGSTLIVSSERNLVRFYVQLGSINPGEPYDRDSVTPASILAKAIRKDVTREGRVFIAGGGLMRISSDRLFTDIYRI
ncbi:BQ5605_C048g12403 [Microbotryum silenes-dioicae]|uniref:BQ5605_C024g09937 protein n=1 Tax=Microbotryum silenes-dioicae TaxID=796604 RepID=A0A2X0PHT7_9BASI|nr:BQ5605_C024g09937 [Microbotryum silenes-dioicae]SGZ30541.1 BQ5605_C048g12403 [Microbotryum silenes-dioicae]